MSYLLETPTYYYFRIKVPKDLRPVLKKREIKKSLKTANRHKANRLAAIYAIQCQDLFEALRRSTVSDFPFTYIKVAEAFKTEYGVKLTGVEMDPNHPEAEERLLNALVNKLAAVELVQPAPVAVTTPTPPVAATPTQPQGMLLSTATDAFLTEKTAMEPDSLYYKYDVPDDLDLLKRVIGDVPVSGITRLDAVNFFNTLKSLPPNLNKSPLFRGKTIDQILKIKAKPRSASTINGVMTSVRALFDWLTLYNHVTQNCFIKLKMPRSKKISEERQRFDGNDLKAMFSDKVFTAHKYKHAFHYWLPLIALHSGMRMNEICQLRPKDVYYEGDILMMNVTEDNEEMSVKTEAGIRRVPVHPKLIELGFNDFRHARRKEEWLFDGLTVEEDGRRSKKASKWMTSTFRPRVGLKVKGKDFHSFRHTNIDDLKQLQVNLHVLKALVGHSRQLPEVANEDITIDRYGKDYWASTLYDMICKLDYAGSLTAVKPWVSGVKIRSVPTQSIPKIEASSDDLTRKIFKKSLEEAQNL